jgi:hypothetical protein
MSVNGILSWTFKEDRMRPKYQGKVSSAQNGSAELAGDPR